MTEAKPCLPECWKDHKPGPFQGFIYHAPGCPNAPKPPEAPKVEWDNTTVCFGGDDCPNCEREKAEGKTAPAPEPDPLMGIDAQKWAREFMRIWSGRWSEVDEGLMIGWFANAIMRGFDEGQRRLRKQHGCELPPLAEPKPSAPPAPEPKQWSEEPIDWEAADQCAGVWKDEGGSEETLARAYLALRADLAAADQNLKTMLQTTGEEAERQLATAREEISKLREMRAPTTPTVEMVRLRQSNQNLMMLYANAIGECRKINKAIHRVLRGRNNAVKQLAAEKARADRAEERVKVLEDVVVNANRVGWNEALSMEASSINAARARKEGGSNA